MYHIVHKTQAVTRCKLHLQTILQWSQFFTKIERIHRWCWFRPILMHFNCHNNAHISIQHHQGLFQILLWWVHTPTLDIQLSFTWPSTALGRSRPRTRSPWGQRGHMLEGRITCSKQLIIHPEISRNSPENLPNPPENFPKSPEIFRNFPKTQNNAK